METNRSKILSDEELKHLLKRLNIDVKSVDHAYSPNPIARACVTCDYTVARCWLCDQCVSCCHNSTQSEKTFSYNSTFV